MPNRYFFATADDLLPGFERLESIQKVRYVECGNFTEARIPEYSSGKDLPNLGIADGESSVGCKTYLMLKDSDKLELRKITLTSGGVVWAVDQLANPDSVVICTGGNYKDVAFVRGSITSTCASPVAKKLLQLASNKLISGFTKVRTFWLGPDAYQLFRAGFRFVTAGVQSPIEYDLQE